MILCLAVGERVLMPGLPGIIPDAGQFLPGLPMQIQDLPDKLSAAEVQAAPAIAGRRRPGALRRAGSIAKRAAVSFYRDQGTHHAGALTYYALMSLFPLLLLTVSLLGLIGEYPSTYNAIVHHLRPVVPAKALNAIDGGLKEALRDRGTAVAALLLGTFTAFYGATGYLEATRRAMNVVFRVRHGRTFLRRKLTDIASTVVLLVLVTASVVLMFAPLHVVRGLVGSELAFAWRYARWPLALVIALLIFSFLYSVTPDARRREPGSIAPGAAVAVTIWLLASEGFSQFLSRFSNLNATYGSFGTAVVLLVWLWLTNIALFFGAEVNAEIARRRPEHRSRPEPGVPSEAATYSS